MMFYRSPFFIHPVFRDGGHFMILSQFQAPNHFLLALLEDYKMDPARAQPLLTLSVFDDLAESKDLALVRCDIINNGIEDDEGYKLAKCLISDYSEEELFTNVHLFNKVPDKFDVDAFVSERESSWKADA
jgi:ATP synthase F1 complex assembly factor 1